MREDTPGAVSGEGAYLLVPRASTALVIASHAVSREDSPQRACPSACARDLTAAFRYGPACFTTCGDMWVAWNSLYSALGIRCSARKRMIIRSIERVDYTAALATLVGPSIYMSTLIAGICVEIVTDRNREDARGWVHVLPVAWKFYPYVCWLYDAYPKHIRISCCCL